MVDGIVDVLYWGMPRWSLLGCWASYLGSGTFGMWDLVMLVLLAVCGIFQSAGLPHGHPRISAQCFTLPGDVSEALTMVALDLLVHRIQLLLLHIAEVHWLQGVLHLRSDAEGGTRHGDTCHGGNVGE